MWSGGEGNIFQKCVASVSTYIYEHAILCTKMQPLKTTVGPFNMKAKTLTSSQWYIDRVLSNQQQGGLPRGRVGKFLCSTAGGPVFCRFGSWAQTWSCSASHAEAASHMPQLEGPTTKNIQLCTGGLWEEKGKNKILK